MRHVLGAMVIVAGVIGTASASAAAPLPVGAGAGAGAEAGVGSIRSREDAPAKGRRESAQMPSNRRQEPATARSEPPPGLAPDDPRARCLAAHADAPPRYRGLVRALCSELHSLGIAGASLAIGEGGALRYVAAWGVTRRGGPPITPATGFRVGSITKLLTAALALALVDDGRLRLDAPLADVVPELAEGVDDRLAAITLRQLLTHAGGLADLWPADASPVGDAWLAALGERELIADPGARWGYANVGYAIVGAAIERAGGAPWGELLGRRILAPLELRRISADLQMSLETGAAHGHLGRGAEAIAVDVVADFAIGARGATWTAPAGGVIAPAGELAELALGLVDPARSPLTPAAIEALTTPTIATGRVAEGQAPGLRVRPLAGGGALLQASGDTGDFAADLFLAPDRGLVLVILGNSGDHLRATAALGLRELFGVEPAGR